MDRHTCKLCFRRFQNGRALGGHMRSHVMAAAAAAATAAAYSPPQQQRQQSPPVSFASTSSTDIDGKLTQPSRLSCFLREDPKVGAPEFSGSVVAAAAGESSVVQDGESDTESPRVGAGFGVCRRRSKRARRRAAPDPEPASSVSDATREEDVAMSLVMLSRDSWTRSRSEPEEPHWARASWEAEQDDSRVNLLDEEEYDVAGKARYGKATAARPRSGRHQCGACRKVFRSYQALGGHRASVKKGKGGCVPPAAGQAYDAHAPVVHECPFCFRVFGSGQALGGHKRAHTPFGGAGAPSPAKCGDSFGPFDLNVPVAFDDDFELSAVYDAEFGSTRQ
ncbi:zinc finger protein ZAT9 [Lolium perenne]|uniref:zinc finger protein ZAT9 n=1 Tax=Lolium perenne TaxID=4522 RepID=UPI0021EAEE6F|nr:zinc finger protein ZAT9-like [Lolium perenne]